MTSLVIEPNQFRTFPCPTYPEIRLAWLPYRRLAQLLRRFRARLRFTSRPKARSARRRARWCLRNRFAVHDVVSHAVSGVRAGARADSARAELRASAAVSFGAAARTMVATPTMQRQLEARGFRNIVRWTRGVDVELFKPRDKGFLDLPRPICDVRRDASRWRRTSRRFSSSICPARSSSSATGRRALELQANYPTAQFVGFKFGEELAAHRRRCRRVRVSEPHRHVRPGAARSDGVRRAGRCLSGDRADRRRRERRDRRARRRPASRGAGGAEARSGDSAARTRSQHTWEAATRQFLANLAPRQMRRSAEAPTLSS